MHKSAMGHRRQEIVQQVINNEPSVKDYVHYVPIGHSAGKIEKWAKQGAQITYITSRRDKKEVQDIFDVLIGYNFPQGTLECRKQREDYKDVAERIMPDIIIEDDCESIGGKKETTYPHIRDPIKEKIKSIIVKEFSGIDFLPDDLRALAK